MSPAPGRRAGLVALLAATVVACSPGATSTVAPGSPTTPSPTTVPAATDGGELSSPVEGVPIDIDTEGFSDVAAFTIRTLDGSAVTFTMGILENGAEFPPNHLAEHLAGSTPVRVFFRRDGAEAVVYRLEDAEPAP